MYNIVCGLLCILTFMFAVNNEVISIILVTIVVFWGIGLFGMAVLKEVERREQERRNAEW